MSVLATGLALACSQSGGPATDGATTKPCTGAEACDGDVLYTCSNGHLGGVIRNCAPFSCADNACLTTACAAADRDDQSFAGCLFYALIPDNVASDAAKSTSFLIANPGLVPASVALQRLAPGAGGGPPAWSNIDAIDVAAEGAGVLSVAGGAVAGTGLTPAAALRVMTDQPVTAIEVDSDDQTLDATSSGGSMLLPTRMLGGHYRVVTYPQIATDAVTALEGGRGGAGRVIVVGTRDATEVTLHVADAGSTAAAEGVPALSGGASYMFTIDDGDVFQLYSGGEGADLTGSELIAQAPIAVFSGNITTSYGRSSPSASGAPAVNSPDLAHEQLPRIGAWNATYVAAQLPPQAGACDSLFGTTGGSLWRVVAARDGTEVRFEAGAGVMGLPPGPIALGAGEVRELLVFGGSFTVHANPPVLLTQGIDCEPSLSLGVGVDHLLADLRFSVLPNFDQVVAVVRRSSHPTVMLDEQPIPDSAFTAAGSSYEVAQVALERCAPSAHVCAHHLAGELAASIRGMDVVCSYAITAAEWTGCVDSTDPVCFLP